MQAKSHFRSLSRNIDECWFKISNVTDNVPESQSHKDRFQAAHYNALLDKTLNGVSPLPYIFLSHYPSFYLIFISANREGYWDRHDAFRRLTPELMISFWSK